MRKNLWLFINLSIIFFPLQNSKYSQTDEDSGCVDKLTSNFRMFFFVLW